MANSMRWRYGDPNPVLAAVDAATVIEIGDLVYLDVDDAKPAASQADQGTFLLNQQVFQDNFLGVAMQASATGETNPIRIATTGVFEYDCPAATYEVGKLLGGTENAGGTALAPQKLEGVNVHSAAIGRCTKRVNPAAAKVLVDIVSTVMHGGPQAPA